MTLYGLRNAAGKLLAVDGKGGPGGNAACIGMFEDKEYWVRTNP